MFLPRTRIRALVNVRRGSWCRSRHAWTRSPSSRRARPRGRGTRGSSCGRPWESTWVNICQFSSASRSSYHTIGVERLTRTAIKGAQLLTSLRCLLTTRGDVRRMSLSIRDFLKPKPKVRQKQGPCADKLGISEHVSARATDAQASRQLRRESLLRLRVSLDFTSVVQWCDLLRTTSWQGLARH